MNENKYQSGLIKRLQNRYPGCMVLKNDSGYIQGVPDLTILYGDRWATLECKKDSSSSHRPNQEYYVNRMNEMSFSSFIYPENETDVFKQLDSKFSNSQKNLRL